MISIQYGYKILRLEKRFIKYITENAKKYFNNRKCQDDTCPINHIRIQYDNENFSCREVVSALSSLTKKNISLKEIDRRISHTTNRGCTELNLILTELDFTNRKLIKI